MNKRSTTRHLAQGFTLLEILLVIGIVAVLATVVIVSLNPVQRFNDARNSRRLSDIQSILSAVQQYMVDNKGASPSGLSSSFQQIGTANSNCSLSTDECRTDGCVDLSGDLRRYLKDIPFDPENGSESRTGYAIEIDENSIVTVKACYSTDSDIASVSH